MAPSDATAHYTPSFRLAIVPGTQPDKWVRTWRERLPDVPLILTTVDVRHQEEAFAAGADAALLRLPVDRDRFEAIPLYTETTVVVIAKDHLFAAAQHVSPTDLVGELVLVPLDDVLGQVPDTGTGTERPATTAAAVELVAAGVGVLVVPQSLARLHHRRDLTFREVTDQPTSSVGLVWPRGATTDLVEEMIGIVRGRTANSSRGRAAPQHTGSNQPKKATAAEGGAKSDRGRERGTAASTRGSGPRAGGRPGNRRSKGRGRRS
jgi:DNA-binding transcriptional LysR family regulator